MAMIHADGFDHWGTRQNMEIGGWIWTNNQLAVTSISTDNNRTGDYSLLFPVGVQAGFNRLRRMYDGANNTCIVGFAHFTSSTYLNEGFGVTFNNLANDWLCTILFNNNGGFTAYKNLAGDPFGTNLGQSLVNVVTPGSYNYIEMKMVADSVAGQLEVRVNGVTVLLIAGNVAVAGTKINGFTFGKLRLLDIGRDTYIDDLVLMDGTGTINNDFIGDVRCYTSFPDADTADAQWALSSGTDGFALIDEVPPNTGGYIEAVNPGDVSEFEKTPIGIEITGASAVMLFALAAKTDAGVTDFRLGVQVSAVVENSALLTPGTAFAYYSYVFERNPNGNIPWTKTSLNLTNIRVTREA